MPLYIWMPPYVWMAHILRGPYAPNTFVHLPSVWTPSICLDAPVHTQHKISMLYQTKGVSIYPHTFGWPQYVWMSLICLASTLYVCIPSYVWMSPVCLSAPICLDTPVSLHAPYVWTPLCMFGCPHMFGCTPCMFGCPSYVWMASCMFGCLFMFGCPHMFGQPLYVWMMFGCPLYIHNTKKACFVILSRCPYVPIHLDAPYVWIPPCMFECSPCMFG